MAVGFILHCRIIELLQLEGTFKFRDTRLLKALFRLALDTYRDVESTASLSSLC